MNIIVCVKQVPSSNQVEIDTETGVLKREQAGSKMNPYDLFALEAANQIKEKVGGKITAITMGPPSAKDVLHEAMALGADDAILMSDYKFAGADVLATSYTLALGINTLDYDLILAGKQTIDGDTAQVGPAIAEHLGINHLSWVDEIIEVDDKNIVATQVFDDYNLKSKIELPALMSINEDTYSLNLPSYKKLKASYDKDIKVICADDLDANESDLGLKGSPTQVERIFEPTHEVESIQINYDSLDENIDALYEHLINKEIIGGNYE